MFTVFTEKQFRMKICDCGLCEGEIHAYIWTAEGEKFGPFTLSFAAVIALIELALQRKIVAKDAVDGGMFALDRLSSAMNGDPLTTPAIEGLEYVKKRISPAGHKMAEEIFSQAIEEEAALAEKDFGANPKPETAPLLRVV